MRLLAIGMRLLAITLRLAMGARAIVREAIRRAIRRAITHAISSWEPTHPIWRTETTSKSTPAIGPHSSHWSKRSPSSIRTIRSHTTRHTKSWVAINILENVHRIAQLDAIGSKTEPLLAEPWV